MIASTLSSTDTSFLQTLERAKQELWRSHHHLSEHELQGIWLSTVSNIPSNGLARDARPSPARHVPRTMSFGAPSITQTPTPDQPNCMDRIRSAPASVPMGRSLSSHSVSNNANTRLTQRSTSSMPSWHMSNEEPSTDYIFGSKSGSDRKRPLHPIDETSTFTNDDDILEYSPAEYVSTCIEPTSSAFPIPTNQHANRLTVAQLTSNSQWSQLFDGSTSPSTPTTASLMTPSTRTSSSMSHQSGISTQLMSGVSMLRVDSDVSHVPVLCEDSFPIPFSSAVDSKNISLSVDNSSFLVNFTGLTSESFFPLAPFSPSASALTSFENQSNLAEDMRRSTSVSDESDSSNASVFSTSSRHSRRDREIIAQSSRKIAPKASQDDDEKAPAASNSQMLRIQSEDGSSRNVGVISKAPYVRPHHPKIMCDLCNENPRGFRGEHELRRHTERAHAPVRKAYICVDNSPGKKFLANCKHCRNGKKYGAYYNAAAHLRRAHFNPRKRGRKGKTDEKRGGIGGGDKPPMNELKEYWIQEVEVKNDPSAQHSQESDSDDANCVNNNEAFDYDTFYEPSPLQAEASNGIDYSPLMDCGLLVNSSFETPFDPTGQFTAFNNNGFPTVPDNSFQFDAQLLEAYMPQ